MRIAAPEKIVLLGMMSRIPVAGNMWLIAQYMEGFRRLGYEPYYVEAHARTPSMLMRSEADDSSALAAGFIDRVMRRIGFPDRWAFHALHADGRYYGMSEGPLKALYRSASLIVNVHGATLPLPEHSETGRLVYLNTDPVEVEVELHQGVRQTIDFLEPHCAFFTWGLNYGSPDCAVPVSERFHFRPTLPPIVPDFWEADGPGGGRSFTTIGNWRQAWRTLRFQGETYHWSKHLEFLKFLDLPRRTTQEFELALGSYTDDDRRMLEARGWRVRDAAPLSAELDPYREYIARSRGEFTVAKDQNVRLRSGWFSERSSQYLASGRPVITQETGFGNVLPTGAGLFGFSTMEEILRAVDAVNTDYERHSRAARQIARECFGYEVVLREMLERVGLSLRKRAPAAPGAWRIRIEARPPATLPAAAVVEVPCVVENLGSAVLVSAPPHPVHASYRWIDGATGERVPDLEGARTRLPRPLTPGDTVPVPLRVRTPARAGEYVLRVTLVREQVAWFDGLDERNAADHVVRVEAAGSSAGAAPGAPRADGAVAPARSLR